jgi:succinate dehydrogenase/fumarate reductase cytochrome b subunit
MKKNGFNIIFYGMLFVLINIPINGVDILPDFIGYILFAAGYEKLKNKSVYFDRVRKFIWLLIIISFASFYRSAYMQTPDMSRIIPEILLAVITFVFIMLNFYNLFKGIRDMADKKGYPDISVEADKRWKQIVILNLMALLLVVVIFIPVINILYILALAVFSIYMAIKMMKLIRRCSKDLVTNSGS